MSAGEIAGLIAAGALVLLVVLLAVPLLKLGRTLDETTLTIRQVREQSAPILSQASTTVTHVNTQPRAGRRHHRQRRQRLEQRRRADQRRRRHARQPADQGRRVQLRRAQRDQEEA